MRNCRIFLILSAIAILGVFGCSGKKEPAAKSQPAAKVLAKVNGTPITEDDLRLTIRAGHGMAPEGEKLRALDDVIQSELLYQEGLKLGIDKDPGYLKDIAKMEKQMANMKRAEITRRLYNTQIASKVEITNQEAQEYYNKNVDQIQTERSVAVDVIDRDQVDRVVVARTVVANDRLDGPRCAQAVQLEIGWVQAAYRLAESDDKLNAVRARGAAAHAAD